MQDKNSMTPFQSQRAEDDAALLASLGMPKTRTALRRAVGIAAIGNIDDVASPAGVLMDRAFCAAARLYGCGVCDGCERLTLNAELNSMGNSAASAPTICDDCREHVDAAVASLPQWVRDRDLADVLPALTKALVRTMHDADGLSVILGAR